jgi:transposase InsO family protein
VRLALDEPAVSPRELAVRFTDSKSYFVSEASVYRLLKDHDLIASPAFIVMKAADEFKDKTTAPNQLWQTDFTYLKVIGWGWFYLSTVRDDFSRYIIAWKLGTTMKALCRHRVATKTELRAPHSRWQGAPPAALRQAQRQAVRCISHGRLWAHAIHVG